MIKIKTDKCEKCIHNNFCTSTGYIDSILHLEKLIEEYGILSDPEMLNINIDLACAHYAEPKTPPISYPPGVRGIEIIDLTQKKENDKSLDDYLKSPTATPHDINYTKACNCALPAMTGSTECCKNCMNNTTNISITTNSETSNYERKC